MKLEDRTLIQKVLFENQGNKIHNGEVVVSEFACAVQLKILIQGTLYISSDALYFYSRINDSIKLFFGKKTKLKIKLTDIVMIEKGTTLNLFHNAI